MLERRQRGEGGVRSPTPLAPRRYSSEVWGGPDKRRLPRARAPSPTSGMGGKCAGWAGPGRRGPPLCCHSRAPHPTCFPCRHLRAVDGATCDVRRTPQVLEPPSGTWGRQRLGPMRSAFLLVPPAELSPARVPDPRGADPASLRTASSLQAPSTGPRCPASPPGASLSRRGGS